MDNIFGLLLVCIAGTWSSDRESYEFAEGFRGVLVTTSRRCRLLDCRPNPRENENYKNLRVLDQIWYSWVDVERRKRLGLAIYVRSLKLWRFSLELTLIALRLPISSFVQQSAIR